MAGRNRLRSVSLAAIGFIATSVLLIERAAERQRETIARYGCAGAVDRAPLGGAQGAVFEAEAQGVLEVVPPSTGSLQVRVVPSGGRQDSSRTVDLRTSLPAGRYLVTLDSGPLFERLGGRSTFAAVSVVVEPGTKTIVRPRCSRAQ